MVDFAKRLGKRELSKPIDPIAIYDTLDRASDKGELRPVQAEVLNTWNNDFRTKRDVILKLHTGQGKTLIGLLILQAKLNEGIGPAVFLCPNNYLIEQTCQQAHDFGIRFSTASNDLPTEFLDSKSILITSVQKMFNGRSKFGIRGQYTKVGGLVLDDCHACIDSIRDAFAIRLEREDSAYKQILDLFSSSLEAQGAGTYSDLCSGEQSALIPVPYWDWRDKSGEVTNILQKKASEESQNTSNDASKRKRRHEIWFVWPLIKDIIKDCFCVIAGDALEIIPRLSPLDLFGSYFRADHRVFMSATVTDDSFLVKGLRLSPETIRNPLISKNERWSGEKMILIPSLIHESLDRENIVKEFGTTRQKRFGVVALTPSFAGSRDWEAYGATIADTSTIAAQIEKLKEGKYDSTLVIANRYDGIDLPDNTCRALIFDSRPYAESFAHRYEEQCRPNSEITVTRVARIIEQGLGRSVRGQKDYCVIILIGAELIRAVHSQNSRKYFSDQTRAQIELGLEIADMAREETAKNDPPLAVLHGLINKCLGRDDAWKAFYIDKMDAINFQRPAGKVLEIYMAELEAELAFQSGDPREAVKIIQNLVDSQIKDVEEQGWYLQEMARYTWDSNKTESNKLQLEAHKKNRYLLSPRNGMQVAQLKVSQKRIEKILKWITAFPNYEQLDLAVQDILARLEFGTKAERFEQAFKELGDALGFGSERPDKEWKAGPDNLWAIEDGHFLLVECKSEVDLDRAEINKTETGQINNACVWFANNYPGTTSTNILIISTSKVGKAGGFSEPVQIMKRRELRKLCFNVKMFFNEFRETDFKSLSELMVQKSIDTNKLTAKDLKIEYGSQPHQL
jgi:replicative superfamily II helicase